MPCDTRLKPRQSISQRAAEVKKTIERIAAGIASGRIKAKVGAQGAIAFLGVSDEERDGVTDACVYRRLTVGGNSFALAAIARAEQMAGRSVDKQMIGQGVHSHDGGQTWHDHKG